ncbi:MAG: alpha/beta hydrolase [Bacteroides sp.]
MRNFILTSLLLCLSMETSAQQVVELWSGNVPGAVKEKQPLVTDVQTEKGVIRVTEVTNPTLTVYKPTGNKNGTGVIVCPGGGYGLLAFDKEGTEIAQWLAKQGFTAFVLAYRVPNQQAGALQDIQRAIRLVRQEYKLEKVGAIGFSAGASLSARAATRFGETLYPPMDAADKLSCRPDFALLIYPAYLDQGEERTLTPELTLSEQTPPMFLFSTSDDYFSNSALVMAQALRDRKISVELHLMPAGGHGYGMRSGAGLQWPPMAKKWLKEQTNLSHYLN